MTIIDEYKKASQRSNKKFIPKYPTVYYPQLTQEDYHREYFNRYFVKLKPNKNSIIIEVDEKNYKNFLSQKNIAGSSFFITLSLRWKIVGYRDDIIVGNTKTVESKEHLMSGIGLKLGNRLQFWKEL